MWDFRKNKNKKTFKTGEICAASELKIGQAGRVIKIDCKDLAIKQRIIDMGVTTGVEIKIKKFAPLKDPVSIEVRGYMLALRLSELKDVKVEELTFKQSPTILTYLISLVDAVPLSYVSNGCVGYVPYSPACNWKFSTCGFSHTVCCCPVMKGMMNRVSTLFIA